MTINDYFEVSIWEAFFIASNKANTLSDEQYSAIDKSVASQLNSIDDVIEQHFQFAWNVDLCDALSNTSDKLNEIFQDNINRGYTFPNWFILSISAWLNNTVKQSLITKWIEDDKDNLEIEWILRNSGKDPEIQLGIFKKLIKMYKSNKSETIINQISDIFTNIDKKYLNDACKVLANSTSAISACLLNRNDISADYIIIGLKALSKLSKQRHVNAKIELEMLNELGPKARLDAMKQLLGLMSKWYHKKVDQLPFTSVPSREEVANFLFPCSMKYNKEVSDVMERFDKLKPYNNKNDAKEVIL